MRNLNVYLLAFVRKYLSLGNTVAWSACGFDFCILCWVLWGYTLWWTGILSDFLVIDSRLSLTLYSHKFICLFIHPSSNNLSGVGGKRDIWVGVIPLLVGQTQTIAHTGQCETAGPRTVGGEGWGMECISGYGKLAVMQGCVYCSVG